MCYYPPFIHPAKTQSPILEIQILRVFTMRFFMQSTLVVLTALSFATGCARMGREPQQPLVAEEQVEAGTRDQYESQLRDMVGRRVAQLEASREEDKGRVLYRKPYFYKEYASFTESAQSADVEIRETDSRSRPYEGKVEIGKIRYATKMHKTRAEASTDNAFIRQTGTEVLNYELRNGRWNRVGSIFTVDLAEEQVNGEWVEVQEERATELMQEPEIERGFFGKFWDRVSGK